MSSSKSSHILNTSSNLLGFCFIIITSLKIGNKSQQSYIDEFVIVASLFFMLSSIFSFLSIRKPNESGKDSLETTADYLFIGGLSILFIVIIFIAFNIL